MKKMCLVLFAASYLVGCATTYKSNGIMGGYSDMQLGENVFKVSFRGNAYTNPERAADFCLLRSAEVAHANGFEYFVIVEDQQSSKTGTYISPTTTKTTANAKISGNKIYGTATSTSYGGQVYRFSKPKSSNTILCFKEKPDIQGLVYSVEFVSRSIRNKYNIR